ncbi:MAG: elongation factor P maturation arginine rhamnosyltransferase EarP, partial [Burkholderiales bacterium]|nr:elongation factor P maturation arginine rhamnosyltransferase EarP [Burkholderiales bacterium]
MNTRQRWDIFCTVVDNYGDIGVCWRLARQLAAEQGLTVRLWVDDLEGFAKLAPQLDPQQDQQQLKHVEIWRWRT